MESLIREIHSSYYEGSDLNDYIYYLAGYNYRGCCGKPDPHDCVRTWLRRNIWRYVRIRPDRIHDH